MERLPFRRIAAFGFVPVLAAIAPVMVIPIIVFQLGDQGWSALAVGQSVGGIGAVIVQFAWPALGPAIVAGRGPGLRWREYSRSLRIRLTLFAVVAIPAWIIAATISPGPFASAAGMSAVAFCTYGLTPSWYFVGTGRASGVAAFETIPRLISMLAAMAVLAATANPFAYPLCILMGSLVGVLASWLQVRRQTADRSAEAPVTAASLRPNLTLTLSGLVTSGYTIGSTAIVASVASSVPVVASFAAVFRIQYLARTPAATLTTALQGWVAEGPARHKRMRTALVTMTGLGLAAGLSTGALLGFALDLLFPGSSAVSALTATLCGLAVLSHAVSASTAAHILIPSTRAHVVSVSTILAGCVGVPLLIVLTPLFGVDGAVASLLAAEVLVVAIQLPIALRIVLSPDDSLPGDPSREGVSDL